MIPEQASQEDLAEILALQKLCYQESARRYHDNMLQPLTQTMEAIEEEFRQQVFFKIIHESCIIGSVRGYQKEGTGFIGKLIVHPDFQNKGLGTALMRAIENHFYCARRFELFTGHRDEKNIHFYKKLGYKIFKEEKISETLTLVYLEKEAVRSAFC